MRIGIEVQRLFRAKKFGIETSALELIKALTEIEPKHQYIVFAKDDQDRNCLAPSDNLKIKTIGGNFFIDFEQVFLPLAARREQVDVLHCTGNTAPFVCPVPVVQTLHDVIFMDAIPGGDSLYQRFGNHYRRKVVPLVTPRSKAVITVSQYEKDRIVRSLGIKREKIHVVYNGINEARFTSEVSTMRKREVQNTYGLPDHFILFLGNESTRKNPGRVIEAYIKYAVQTDHPLPLVTPGLSQKFIRHKLRSLNYVYDPQRFITPGYISDHDLPVLYTLCRIFLFPSLSEGFGMPLIEAMACGAPVVTSDTSCLPEIAGNAAVFANPLKAEDIASGIIRLASDEALRTKKIQAGMLNAKRFSWKQTAESVLHLYEAVYAEARARQKAPGFFHRHVFATRD
jgi:glycosyltransferase involved in cell wall biosynthesis